MLKQIFLRIRRAPKMALGVIAFALVLSLALCGLEQANKTELENYENARRTVPVTLTVTNLTGMKTSGLDIPHWAVNVFTGERLDVSSLSELVKDLKLKKEETNISAASCNGSPLAGLRLVGLTSLDLEPQLSAQAGDMLTWQKGYDESILATDAPVCIVPESWLAPEGPTEVYLKLFYTVENYALFTTETSECELTLTAVASHKGNSMKLYCPYPTLRECYRRLNKPVSVDSLGATVLDNDTLPQVREFADRWFAQPDLKGEKTPWDYSWYAYYPLALKIDDSQLKSARETMENSILMNSICTVLVFVLAAGASFFVGFLMIRSRKREITLFRTMGTPPTRIFASFALEQLLCILAGIFLGGMLFLWRPLDQLALFAGLYAGGLLLALLIFLSKNLMSTMKEDE